MNPVDPHPPMTQPGAPMTPERAAYLRAQYAHANSVMGEALDEIERLRGLVERRGETKIHVQNMRCGFCGAEISPFGGNVHVCPRLRGLVERAR